MSNLEIKEPSEGRPKRLLGFWMCTALVIGNTIGMGIFLLPASLAPFGFNALIGWVINGFGVLALAASMGRLAQLMPEADGPYGYIRATMGNAPAFLTMWGFWISVWMTTTALAVGVVGYLEIIFPFLTHYMPPFAVSLLLVWVFVAVNLFGIRVGGKVQIITTLIKLLPMVGVALFGGWLLVDSPGVYLEHPPETPISMPLTMAAATIGLYALLGFESASLPAARVKDAARVIPRAIIAGTLTVVLIYIVISAIMMLLIPPDDLATSSAPFVDLFSYFTGRKTGRWLALFVVISALGALNGWTLLVGEVTRTMASNGTLPGRLGRLNRFGSPGFALVFSGGLASMMILMNSSRSLVDGFTFLTVVVTASALPLYMFSAVALVLVWRKNKKQTGVGAVFKGVFGIAFTIYAFFGMGGESFMWAMVLAAAGIPVYVLMRWRDLKTYPKP